MRTSSTLPAWTIAVLVLVLTTANCRAGDSYPGSSLGVHFGYFVPFGDWTAHRYAEGVDLFQGDFTFGGELELRIFGVHVGFFLNYTRLRTTDWENFAQSQGDDISASASMTDYGIRFKYYFVRNAPNFVNLSLGVGGYNLRGQESFAGRTYNYDFLNSGVGIVLGCAYKRQMSPRLALTLEARAIFVAEGVKYADGEVHDVIGVPVTVGLSYLF